MSPAESLVNGVSVAVALYATVDVSATALTAGGGNAVNEIVLDAVCVLESAIL